MEMEQRGWVIPLYFGVNRKREELLNKAKPMRLDDGSRMNERFTYGSTKGWRGGSASLLTSYQVMTSEKF
jgi:hypothetical protein